MGSRLTGCPDRAGTQVVYAQVPKIPSTGSLDPEEYIPNNHPR